jgi:integrase
MSLTKSPAYTFEKDGVFYFSRRIPSVLICHYSSPRIAYSLRTRSSRVAEARARKAADQLDEYWFHIRCRDRELPGKHMLRQGKPANRQMTTNETAAHEPSIRLSEAVAIYLSLKGRDKPITFHRAAERACGYVIDACSDKQLEVYTKADANAFRDSLIKRGLAGSSMTRVFGTVRSVVNFAASEQGLTLNNPFSGVYYDRDAGVSSRHPIPPEHLASVQAQCRNINDDLRWLVALVSDTGLRLAEAAGLLRDDIRKDESGQLVAHIRPHPWRRLKTKGSERIVPLEGLSQWAAQQVHSQSDQSKFAFPRYNKTDTTNANSASAALNKWLKEHVPQQCSMHGFRHSMRDRLRAVECPADVVDQIGGWQTDGVGHSYGSGYPITVLRKWMKEVTGADMVYGS